ncbi:MAG TPA: DUF2252 family protein [Verrucomicrobiae bacterium]|jgi:hypothetical protein|nr:DUF2252 family protein [Verrucomicrobiae bacterium]
MDVKQATTAYEAWLGKKIPLLPADLKLKHQRMTEGVFPFLRATFYRWAQLWPEHCPELTNTPVALAVGDLHVENFGTWRDVEGRLIWGINDFDEACKMPFAVDLVRLATSALLAASEGTSAFKPADACAAILEGYTEGIQSGGQPFVLAECHHALSDLALNELRDPVRFWDKLNQWPQAENVPADVKALLVRALPKGAVPQKIVHRQAGLGSLGRRRFTVIAEWRGGYIAREAKELVPSAWYWNDARQSAKIFYTKIISQAVRVTDHTVAAQRQWLVRRLAPDCSRIELNQLPLKRDELKLLHATGRETANIHVGTPNAAQKIAADLRKRPSRWLFNAAQAMEWATINDWKQWRK